MTFELQTLILSKKEFPKKKDAETWIKKNNFKVSYMGKPVDEKENTFRFRQMAPSKFNEETYRTKTLKKGVKAVFGRLKKKK